MSSTIETSQRLLSVGPERIPEDLIPLRKRTKGEEKPETAEEYTALAEQKFAETDRAFVEFLATKIPQHASVLDIGSGPGIQAIELLKIRPDIKSAFLLDLDPKMLLIARLKAKAEGVFDRVTTIQGDMTRIGRIGIPKGSYVYTHTSLHSLRHEWQLRKTLRGAKEIAGETGGLYFRDLRLPPNLRLAKEWREEVLGVDGDKKISERELELFTKSQLAGWSIQQFQESARSVGLDERGEVLIFDPPNSRYIDLEVKPKPAV